MSKFKISWKFFCGLPLRKADGQALRNSEVQKSTRQFSNGLDLKSCNLGLILNLILL